MRKILLAAALLGSLSAFSVQAGEQREPEPLSPARAADYDRTQRAEQLIWHRAALQAQARRARLAARKTKILASPQWTKTQYYDAAAQGRSVVSSYTPEWADALYLSTLTGTPAPVIPEVRDSLRLTQSLPAAP